MVSVNKTMLINVMAFLLFFSANAAGGPKVDLDFEVSLVGDVDGGAVDTSPVRGNNTPVWFTPIFFTLDTFFLGNIYGGSSAAECFGGGNLQGGLQLTKPPNGGARATFWFAGDSDDGSDTEILYRLTLVDPNGWDGPFPPENDSISMFATDWEMRPDAKGRLKIISCIGSGDTGNNPADVTITLFQPPS